MTRKSALPPMATDKPDADKFGRSMAPGIGANLLVTDIETSARFQAEVLDAEIVYWDQDFAILKANGSTWMLHHDRTYRNHPLGGVAVAAQGRGAGAELRLYGRNPDDAEAASRRLGGTVLAGSADKPHGLREAYLLDPDGYLWVPSVPKSD